MLKPAKGQKHQKNYQSDNKSRTLGETSPSIKSDTYISNAPNEHKRFNRGPPRNQNNPVITYEKEYPDSETNSQQFSGGEKEKYKPVKTLKN